MVKKLRLSLIGLCSVLLLFGSILLFQQRNTEKERSKDDNKYKTVTWNNAVNFTAGDCDTENYTGWCPHNLQYDKTRNKFVFLQSHSTQHLNGKFVNMTLCYLDPSDPLNYKKLNCPDYEGLGALLVKDDGTWYIWTEDKRYMSKDAGETWKEDKLITPLPTRYGVYDLDGTLYMGDDSAERGIYRVSEDDGLTWETKNFGVNYSDCEASFCRFKGKTYAFLRTNETNYACIMQETKDGWKIVDDNSILAYASNCSPVVFDDYIAVAHINRKDCHLYYTIWDGKENFDTTDLGMIESSTAYASDFHSPALAFGNGYACIAFMMHMYGTPTPNHFFYAQNSWIIGTYDDKKLFTCEIKDKYKKSSDYTKELSEVYPSNAETDKIEITSDAIDNQNNYNVCLYNKKNDFEDCMMSSEEGLFVPVKNGNLIAYGTKSAKIDPNSITIELLHRYQPFCILKYENQNYMCIFDESTEQMMSLQRKNYIYESSLVTNCIDIDDETNICFVKANSSLKLKNTIPTVVIKN